jgi:serine/threonine-protein kinase
MGGRAMLWITPTRVAVLSMRRILGVPRAAVLLSIAVVIAGGVFLAVRIAGVMAPHRPSIAASPAAMAPTRTAPVVADSPPRITVRSAPVGRTVRVVVSPTDAHAQVDGIDAPVQGGLVTISAGLGTVHRVRLSAGRREIAVDVTIAEEGAVPPKVEIPR